MHSLLGFTQSLFQRLFSSSHIDLLVDATTGYEALMFMDEYSRYNQIKMHPKDEEMAAFRSPKGVFYRKVMPLVQKNYKSYIPTRNDCSFQRNA